MKQMSCLLMLAVICSASPVLAAGWGTVTGKLVVKGTAPEATLLVKEGENVKDAGVCAVNAIPDDSLVISPKGEVANCFIYLYQRRGTPDIHPDLKTPKEAKVVFDNKGCRFEPHAIVVRTDQVVNVINSDACGHNVHTYPLKNNAYNQLISASDKTGVDIEFNQSELLPMQVKCDIHPWMTAYWYVSDHPYATVSGTDGTFKLENVPAGKHTFRIWHERTGYVERSLDVEVKDGQTTDLGEIQVDGDKLKAN